MTRVGKCNSVADENELLQKENTKLKERSR